MDPAVKHLEGRLSSNDIVFSSRLGCWSLTPRKALQAATLVAPGWFSLLAIIARIIRGSNKAKSTTGTVVSRRSLGAGALSRLA
jgi:hypothetical protein